MIGISRRWRRVAAALILGALAGLATFAVAAMTEPLAGAMLRGLGAAGASPAVVERAAHEVVLKDLAAIRRDVRQARAARARTRTDLEQARRTVATARDERDEIAEDLRQAGLRIRALTGINGALENRLAKVTLRREAAARTVRTASSRVSRRMATAAARNTLSLPAESVPFVGVAAIVTVTTLDLYDTCATVRDMNTIRAALNLPVLKDAAADTCAWIEKLDDNLPIGTSDIPEEVMRDRAHGSEADPSLPSSGDG